MPMEALALWLKAMARKSGAHAVSVGTADGLPLASFGDVGAWSLAAAGCVYAEGDRDAARDAIADLDAKRVVFPDGFEVILTSCGAPVWSEAESHVRRILA